ncbi:MAG: sugar porter family MFS transporter [Opitutales bacterium]|nr:sugar porter family MFS transporter [Opitutales bacterium]
MENQNELKITRPLMLSAFAAALAGLLFGFDTAVIAGVIPSLEKVYALDEWGKGFTVSIALLGTMLGALCASLPADKLGRRDSLKITGALFFVSAVGCALAWGWHSMLFFRFVGGVGIGVASVIAPMYIAEIAPAKYRGVFVATFQGNIVGGILLAYLSNYIVSLFGFDANSLDWRVKLGVEALPAALFLTMLFFVPRSAYWLVKVGRRNEARAVLEKIAPGAEGETIAEIDASLESARRLGNPPLLCRAFAFPLFLAFTISFFNQFSGINAVLYYINDIFSGTGLDENLSAVIVGAANFSFTILAMFLIDKIGRKTLLLIGACGTSLMLLAAAAILKTGQMQGAMVYVLSVYIAFFAMSQGAVIWVYISEIFPIAARAKGVSFGASAHWIFCFIIALVFPYMLKLDGADFGFESVKLNGSFPFFLFFFMTIVQLAVVAVFYPETKGVPLERLREKMKFFR